jgi:hypothetical protein
MMIEKMDKGNVYIKMVILMKVYNLYFNIYFSWRKLFLLLIKGEWKDDKRVYGLGNFTYNNGDTYEGI